MHDDHKSNAHDLGAEMRARVQANLGIYKGLLQTAASRVGGGSYSSSAAAIAMHNYSSTGSFSVIRAVEVNNGH